RRRGAGAGAAVGVLDLRQGQRRAAALRRRPAAGPGTRRGADGHRRRRAGRGGTGAARRAAGPGTGGPAVNTGGVSNGAPLLELRGVRKSYGEGTAVVTEVLHGIDLVLERG